MVITSEKAKNEEKKAEAKARRCVLEKFKTLISNFYTKFFLTHLFLLLALNTMLRIDGFN